MNDTGGGSSAGGVAERGEIRRRARRVGGGASGRTGMMNRNDKAGCVRKGCWRLGGMNCVRQPGGGWWFTGKKRKGGERRGEDAGRLRSQRQVMRMRGGVAFEATPPLLVIARTLAAGNLPPWPADFPWSTL